MGTATQSIANQIQRDEFDNLVKKAIGDSTDREIQLNRVFREIVSKVIATDPALAGVRPALENAINNAVKPAIVTKLQNWINSGRKVENWPFKDISIKRRVPFS